MTEGLQEHRLQEIPVRMKERRNGIVNQTANFMVTEGLRHEDEDSERNLSVLLQQNLTDSFVSTNIFPMQAFAQGEKRMK